MLDFQNSYTKSLSLVKSKNNLILRVCGCFGFLFWGRGLGHILTVEMAYKPTINQTNLETKAFYSKVDHYRTSFIIL